MWGGEDGYSVYTNSPLIFLKENSIPETKNVKILKIDDFIRIPRQGVVRNVPKLF